MVNFPALSCKHCLELPGSSAPTIKVLMNIDIYMYLERVDLKAARTHACFQVNFYPPFFSSSSSCLAIYLRMTQVLVLVASIDRRFVPQKFAEDNGAIRPSTPSEERNRRVPNYRSSPLDKSQFPEDMQFRPGRSAMEDMSFQWRNHQVSSGPTNKLGFDCVGQPVYTVLQIPPHPDPMMSRVCILLLKNVMHHHKETQFTIYLWVLHLGWH